MIIFAIANLKGLIMADRYFSEKEVKVRFDEIMDMVENGDHIFITCDGMPTAVLIPYDEYQRLISFDDTSK